MHAASLVSGRSLERLRDVEPDPDGRREAVIPPVLQQPLPDGQGAHDRCVSRRERHEEAVAGVVDLLAFVLAKEGSDRVVVPGQEPGPGLISDGIDQVGRAHDVREHERAHGAGRGPGTRSSNY